MNFITKNTLGFLLLSVLIISCANKSLIKPGDTLQVAYGKALNQYQAENYTEAAEAFETVIQIGRGTEYGREAQFYLAESYFKNGSYLLAASEYERFTSLYPRSPRREEVDFKEAYSYYKLSPRYRLDQTYTTQAIEAFRLFNSRYPDSERIQKSADYIVELRDKLARKLYNAADLYMRTDQYEAAIVYYDLTIDRYPESTWAEQALVNEINAYNVYAENSVPARQEERYEKAVDSYEKYLQLFPQGKFRQDAESYVDDARIALADLGSSAGSSSKKTASSSN